MSRRGSPCLATTDVRFHVDEQDGQAAEEEQAQQQRCVQPEPVSAAHAAAVRAASESRRQKAHACIHTLRPHLCRNAAPFIIMVALWLCWTVAAPCALLLPDELGQGARGAGWAFLGSGAAYLLLMLAPIVHRGLLCMPRAPPNDGPWLRDQVQLPASLGADAGADANADSSSAGLLLQPQPSSTRVALRGRCVHVIYNSHGVHGTSAKVKADLCIERMKAEGACVHPLLTQYAGHLFDLGRDPALLPLHAAGGDGAAGSVAVVVIVGGDGSLSEWVGGYLERCRLHNIAPSARTPVCLIPGGSGNSFARDLYSSQLDPRTAIESACTGCVKMIDVCMVRDQAGLVAASTNVISWGLIGDTAVAAESWRELGDARYDLCALWFVARRITSRARFVLRQLVGPHNVLRGSPMSFAEDISSSNGVGGGSAPTKGGPASPLTAAAHSRSEVVLSGEKTTAFFNLTQHFGKALRACPFARLDDGLVDVVVAEGGVERRHMLTMFRQLPGGSHLANTAISHFQAQRVLLQQLPLEDDDAAAAADGSPSAPRPFVINIDGENVICTGDLDIQCLSRQIPVCAPL